MKTKPAVMKEGFMTIVVAALLSLLIVFIGLGGALYGAASEAGVAPEALTVVLGSAFVIGIILQTIVFFIIHKIKPEWSALTAVVGSEAVFWILGGDLSLVGLIVVTVTIVFANYLVKMWKLDKKI